MTVGNKAEEEKSVNSLDTICAAIAYAMGIEPPEFAAQKNSELAEYIDRVFGGEKADRVVMYNPDAVARWVYEKYAPVFNKVKSRTGIEVPLAAVMPSVTPVCFATMYTGAQPAIHGIQQYEKPVITIDTLFDALIRAGFAAIHQAGYDFDLCLKICRELAVGGGCVLLSPACASFDMFVDYEDRGRIFKEKVMALA